MHEDKDRPTERENAAAMGRVRADEAAVDDERSVYAKSIVFPLVQDGQIQQIDVQGIAAPNREVTVVHTIMVSHIVRMYEGDNLMQVRTMQESEVPAPIVESSSPIGFGQTGNGEFYRKFL